MWRRLLVLLGVMAAGTTGCAARGSTAQDTPLRFRALVFSKTTGFRHSSIPVAKAAIQRLGAEHGFAVDTTEDAAAFTDANLARYQVVIFAATTGNVLDSAQQAAFERFIRSGKGYVGTHSASDTEYEWPWYGGLVGAYFAGHGSIEPATLLVADRVHPATAHLPAQWVRTDEWYQFKTNPRERVHVLLTLDENSTQTSRGTMGPDHPIAWCQAYDGGRAFYTAGGHTPGTFTEPLFLQHLLKGIEYAAGVAPANCSATQPTSFRRVTLDSVKQPMDLEVATDGRVFYITRTGAVRIIKPSGAVVTADSLAVYTGQEFGLLSVALDPHFDRNHWLYLYYSPVGSRAVDRVSRFTVAGDRLKPGSERVLLEIDAQRDECCHAGGTILFDGKGNLVIATGDNTNPFASDGYAPIDERSGRGAWDAQRTSANTNNLNGKVLRITPQPDGTYRIPPGNLFLPGTPQTRPEIYAMGFRNPYRLGVDPATNTLFLADYGPDAGKPDSLRGPDGRVEWNILDRPGFYGWPYCVGENTPYRDYDFATKQSRRLFDCTNGPTNDSPNNTGLAKLPPPVPAALWMGRQAASVPQLGPTGSPNTSGAYRFDPALKSERKWPAYWDKTVVFSDMRHLFAVQLDERGSQVRAIHPLLSGQSFSPLALKFGPDGALYLASYYQGKIERIDYVGSGGRPGAAAPAVAGR